jgi:hypothetical protein
VRAAACLIAILLGGVLAGCSPLLGIEDPVARGDAGSIDTPVIDTPDIDGGIDSAIDAMESAVDHLKLGVTDFKLARQQLVRFHVSLVHAAGGTDDVTSTATYTTDQPTLISFGAKGSVSGTASGVATITVSLAGATPVSVKATVTAFACHPVINEIKTGTATNPDDEFIEIYNPCTAMVDVTGWTLNYRSANAIDAQMDTHLLITLADPMPPGELRVYGGSGFLGPSVASWATGNGMAQKDGAVGLRDGPSAIVGGPAAGALVDSVAYGAALAGNPFIETKAMAQMANGMSGSRLPFDGKDDDPAGAADGDNSADFAVVATPTPGVLNTP